MGEYAVEMRGVSKIFGELRANDRVDFNLRKGSIHGLLGENGAGKTTLMNVLFGLYQPDEGSILVDGKPVSITSPLKARSLGIGMVHQHFMLARTLTVAENVLLSVKSQRGILRDTKRVSNELRTLSEKYGMDIDPDAKIWQLSVGEQQRVEILSALYLGADILILDEPTAVLTPQETVSFFDTLRQMREDGKSVILITHKLEEIVAIVDELTVLRAGKLVSSCKMTDDITKKDLSRMMVGRDILFNFPPIEKEPGEVRLSIQNASANNDKGVPALKNFALDVRQGEIVGIAGVDGNGQRELCEILTGLRKTTSGKIVLDGEDVTNHPSSFYIAKNISHIPEDRLTTGLAVNWSLKDNLILKSLEKAPFSKKGFLNKKEINKHWADLQQKYTIKAESGDDLARSLSGGNQQKVILAREISANPEVLIANQPTRGLDVGASEYVRSQILEARNNGASVILVSADLEEILQISDRIAVIYSGELMGILPRGASTDEIGQMMMGHRQEVSKA